MRRLDTLAGELRDVVTAAAGSNLDDEHDPEGATVAFEREQLAALRDHVRHRLVEIDDALHRVDVGEYGICRHCGELISAERLAARPTASDCVSCASKLR